MDEKGSNTELNHPVSGPSNTDHQVKNSLPLHVPNTPVTGYPISPPNEPVFKIPDETYQTIRYWIKRRNKRDSTEPMIDEFHNFKKKN